MKLAIVGSRDFDDYQTLVNIMDQYFWDCPLTIISGGAKGADSLGKRYAENDREAEYQEFLPDWNELGKKAGFVRNKQIVDACDMVLAFWDGKSKGTEHTIKLAGEAKKPTFIIYFEN